MSGVVILERIARATRKLEALLAQPGASPAITVALRRAVDALRAGGAGDGLDAKVAALRAASLELAACEAEIAVSAASTPTTTTTDRALIEGAGKVRRSIDRFLGSEAPAVPAAPPVPPPPAPPPDAPVFAARTAVVPPPSARRDAVPRAVAPAGPPVRAPRRAPRPRLTNHIASKAEQLAQEITARMSGDYRRRASLLANPLLRWDKLAQIDAPLARDEMVLGWMPQSTVDALSRVVAQSSEDDDDTRSALEWVLRAAAPAQPSRAPDALVGDLDNPDDGTAIAAVSALAWTGDTALAAPILARARAAASEARAAALLFAAVALGSSAALAETRARVDASDDADPRLYDALAIAGDDSDADRLVRSASRASGPRAERAALAIGHLGSAEATADLARLAGSIAPTVLDEAHRATFGDDPLEARRPASPDRLLRGSRWSIDGVIARLLAPEEPVYSRERLALDLAVRTGLPTPVRYDPTALAVRQAHSAETFRASFASTAPSLRPGRWYYFGYPVPHPR